MSEVTVLDVLLLVLSALFLGIGFAMRRLRSRMETDMRKNVLPYMSMRHMFKHRVGEHKIKRHKK